MTALPFSLLLLAGLVSESSCIQWSPSALKEDAVVHACDNSDLTLSWDVTKTTGESIVVVQWFYEGRSQELIAILSHGHLNVMPTFSGRVELTANAGLVIRHVTSGEKGNYSVEVNAVDVSGGSVMLRRTAIVVIGESLMTTDGQLHASQMPVAVFSNSTQQWHVALACGTFTYPDTPPFTVEWTTPSGQSVSSSQYKEGQFLLLLDNPVSGGSYTCHVPQRSASAACLHGNDTVSSTVTVDDVKTRLTLLEAENRQLNQRLVDVTNQANDKINQANAEITQANARLSNVSDQVKGLEAENRQLKEQLAHANTKISDNKNDITQVNEMVSNVSSQLAQHPHDEQTKRVSFHATHLKDTTPSNPDVLIPTNVLNNQGNGYNPSTGKFTAPVNGTYCFLASLFGYGADKDIAVHLVVDGKEEAYVLTSFDSRNDYDAASLQAVVYVRAGQSVWLRANGYNNQFNSNQYDNSFSGFLITYDP